MKLTLKHVCGIIAAKNLYESGIKVETIAEQAKVSQSTIRKWLKISKAKKKVA